VVKKAQKFYCLKRLLSCSSIFLFLNSVDAFAGNPENKSTEIEKPEKLFSSALKTSSNGKLEILRAPDDLYLPKQKSEITIKEVKIIDLSDIEILLKNNSPELRSSRFKINQDKALLVEKLSTWYPSLSLSGNGLPQYLQSEQWNSNATDTSSKQWKSTLTLQLKWDLINPSRIPEIESAKELFEKSKYNYIIHLNNLILEAKKRYFLLQKAIEEVNIGKTSVIASKKSLKDSKSRFDAGIGTKFEILEAETQLSRDNQMLNIKIRDRNIQRRSLSEILNLPEGILANPRNSPKIIGLWNNSLEGSLINAYNLREELINAKLDISVNNNKANSALAMSQPTFSLFNNLSTTTARGELLAKSPDLDNSISSLSNTIGLNATWKIFDGGSAKALYNYNKEKSKESESEFARKRLSIKQEVIKSFYNLNTSSSNILNSISEVNTSKESLRLARLRFNAGLTTQREVINNQRDLTQAEVNYANAITEYNISLNELQRHTRSNDIKPCFDKEQSQHEVYNEEAYFLLDNLQQDISRICKASQSTTFK
tara:strand:- start:22771 stop:24396 length:1626 start_codon:yes stop_codon:yes gene_type:complete